MEIKYLLGVLTLTFLSGCTSYGGSTTALQGPEVNNCTPGTYCGYNYVPNFYRVPEKHD